MKWREKIKVIRIKPLYKTGLEKEEIEKIPGVPKKVFEEMKIIRDLNEGPDRPTTLSEIKQSIKNADYFYKMLKKYPQLEKYFGDVDVEDPRDDF